MAFPSVTSETGGNDTNNLTTRTITLPSASVGDLLIVAVANDGSATQSWVHDQGFTDLYELNCGNFRLVIKYLVVGSTLDTTITLNTTAAEVCSWSILRIAAGTYHVPPDASGIAQASVCTTTTTPDPPSLTPPWLAPTSDTLWVAPFGDQNSTESITANPTGYTMGTRRFFNNNQAVGVMFGWKGVNATSQDPPAWTINAARNIQAVTLAIRQAGAQTEVITLPLLDGGPTVSAPALIYRQDVTLGLLDAGAAVYAPAVLLEPARVTQNVVEVLVMPDNTPTFVTQNVVEVIVTPTDIPTNVTQVVVEVLHPARPRGGSQVIIVGE